MCGRDWARSELHSVSDFTEVVLSLARLASQSSDHASTSDGAQEARRLLRCSKLIAVRLRVSSVFAITSSRPRRTTRPQQRRSISSPTASPSELASLATSRAPPTGPCWRLCAVSGTSAALVDSSANAVAAGVLKKGGHPHLARALAFLSSQPAYKAAQADLAQRGKAKVRCLHNETV